MTPSLPRVLFVVPMLSLFCVCGFALNAAGSNFCLAEETPTKPAEQQAVEESVEKTTESTADKSSNRANKAEKTGTTAEADSAESAPYLFRYHFEPGEFTHYQLTDKSSLSARKDQFKETTRNQSTVWRQYRVVSVDENGEAVLELMIDRVQLMSQFDDSPPSLFDSADPQQQPEKLKHILATIGRPMNRIRVNARGELLQVQNLQNNQPQEADPAINFLVVFPEKEIAIGDTWNQTLEVEVPVSKTLRETVKLLRKYTLLSVENDLAEIKLVTILATNIRDPAIRTRLMQQTPSGTLHFDLKTQRLLDRELFVNDQVVGAFGPGTLVESKSHRLEKLLPEKSETKIQQVSHSE